MSLVIDPELVNTSTSEDQNKRKVDLADEASTKSKKMRQMSPGSIANKAKYELVGRKVVSLADPFGSPRTAINVGLKHHSGHEGEPNTVESGEIVRQLKFFDAILAHSQGLEEELKTIDASQLQDICSWITTGMSEQRSTDLGSVKHTGLTYLFANHEGLQPPMAKKEDKSGRGFNHPQIARMLCPRKKLTSFDEDPDTIIGALQEGLIKTTASNWPTCFYEDDVYDQDNKAKGLFRGHAALRFYVHLFIGPSAAATDTIFSNTSKLSKNRAWGLMEVTPSIIAYVHVILYFTLSTAPRWRSDVGLMDLSEMAWRIIEMFEDKDDWTRDTLGWWNMRVFPLTKGKGREVHEDSDSEDDVAAIRAQRGKTRPLLMHEHRAAEALELRTPSPPPTERSTSTGSISVVSGTFSNVEASAQDSDLSPCTSDNERDESLLPKTNQIVQSIKTVSTSNVSQHPSPAASTAVTKDLQIDDPTAAGPSNTKKKAPASRNRNPRRRATKKANGF